MDDGIPSGKPTACAVWLCVPMLMAGYFLLGVAAYVGMEAVLSGEMEGTMAGAVLFLVICSEAVLMTPAEPRGGRSPGRGGGLRLRGPWGMMDSTFIQTVERGVFGGSGGVRSPDSTRPCSGGA